MIGLNRIEIIGHLGSGPETRFTVENKPVATFSVAVNTKTKESEETCWFRCVAFDRLATICELYLHKGGLVYIAGRLKVREWDNEAGQKQKVVEITAREVIALEKKKVELDSAIGETKPPESNCDSDDELPF